MPKRKREVEDSDDSVESPKRRLPENEEVTSKLKKKKKHKQTSEHLGPDPASEEDEESLSLSPQKIKKKHKQQPADITAEDAMQVKDISSESNEGLSRSAKKKKKKKAKQNSEASSSNHEAEETPKPGNPTAQKKASISKGFVLFVGQIPHHIKQKDLEKHFATVGGVKAVRLLIYEDSQRPRGCGYVEFIDNEHRKAALKLNGSTLGRAKIKVEYPYQGGKRYGGAQKTKSNKGNRNQKNE